MEGTGLRKLAAKMVFKVGVKDANAKLEKRKRRTSRLAFKKNSPENLLLEIVKLNPIEFLGICKIVGVEIYDEEDVEGARASDDRKDGKPREFEAIWNDLCDQIEQMNRVRRRNLGKLIYAATKKEKEK